jgi:ClpP class serine protease
MSGGTLIAFAADEIVLGEFSVLGPIDPQIVGLPAASIVRARDSKPIERVFDLAVAHSVQLHMHFYHGRAAGCMRVHCNSFHSHCGSRFGE